MSDWDSADRFALEAFADGFAVDEVYECFVDDCRYEWEQAVAREQAEEAVVVAEHAHGVALTAEARAEAVATLMDEAEVHSGEFDDDLERYITAPRAVFSKSPTQIVWSHARTRHAQWIALTPHRGPSRRTPQRRARPRRSRRLVHSRGDPPRDADPHDDSHLNLCGAVA